MFNKTEFLVKRRNVSSSTHFSDEEKYKQQKRVKSLNTAIMNGHEDLVKSVLQKLFPEKMEQAKVDHLAYRLHVDNPFISAIKVCNIEVIKMLLNVILCFDTKTQGDILLGGPAPRGHHNNVLLLIRKKVIGMTHKDEQYDAIERLLRERDRRLFNDEYDSDDSTGFSCF